MNEPTQTEAAFKELRHRILILELAPNERLKEEVWAAKLRVSRAAIRESLTRLLGEGLVYRGKRGGYFVTEMNQQDVREVRELRAILEAAAFELACARATPRQVKEIVATCEDFAHMVEKDYIAGACEVDLRFHHLLVSASSNARLLQAYEKSNIPLFHRQLGRSLMFMNDLAQTEKEHRAIANALKEKNAAKGVRLLRAHFRRGEQGVLKPSNQPGK